MTLILSQFPGSSHVLSLLLRAPMWALKPTVSLCTLSKPQSTNHREQEGRMWPGEALPQVPCLFPALGQTWRPSVPLRWCQVPGAEL